jgi:hypothetical protein
MIEDFEFGYVISEDSLCNVLEKENIEDDDDEDKSENNSEYNFGEEDEQEFEEKCL